ncbi:MAG: GNAT family N-acetyltransferase [Polyangiaceae bacterium]|nr:GNAT family N-acetyltransferase [Polyangiaceae bacterium]
MTDSDLDAVADLYLLGYDVSWTREGARAYIEKFFRFEPQSCFVAEENGLLGAVLGYSFERESGLILYIQELVVSPAARHRGIAKRLVATLRESTAKRPSRVNVKPLVKADTGVLNFYNSLGFERDKAVSFSFDE